MQPPPPQYTTASTPIAMSSCMWEGAHIAVAVAAAVLAVAQGGIQQVVRKSCLADGQVDCRLKASLTPIDS